MSEREVLNTIDCGDDRACCAHNRVFRKPEKVREDAVRDRWYCDNCDGEFISCLSAEAAARGLRDEIAFVEGVANNRAKTISELCDTINKLKSEIASLKGNGWQCLKCGYKYGNAKDFVDVCMICDEEKTSDE